MVFPPSPVTSGPVVHLLQFRLASGVRSRSPSSQLIVLVGCQLHFKSASSPGSLSQLFLLLGCSCAVEPYSNQHGDAAAAQLNFCCFTCQ